MEMGLLGRQRDILHDKPGGHIAEKENRRTRSFLVAGRIIGRRLAHRNIRARVSYAGRTLTGLGPTRILVYIGIGHIGIRAERLLVNQNGRHDFAARRLQNRDFGSNRIRYAVNLPGGRKNGDGRTLLDAGRHGVDGEDERGGAGLTGSDVGNAPILVGLESQRPRTGRNDRNSLGLATRGGDAYRRGLLVVDRDGGVHIAALVVVGAGAESSRSQRREEQRTPKIQTFHKKRF